MLPIRCGEVNGRSMRIWLVLIFKSELGVVGDWSAVDTGDCPLARFRSPITNVEIRGLLRAALTDRYGDRDVYRRASAPATTPRAITRTRWMSGAVRATKGG